MDPSGINWIAVPRPAGAVSDGLRTYGLVLITKIRGICDGFHSPSILILKVTCLDSHNCECLLSNQMSFTHLFRKHFANRLAVFLFPSL